MCVHVLSVAKPQTPRYSDRVRGFTRALANFSDAEQHLFYLWYYQEVPVKKLTVLFGLTPTAVYRRLRGIHRKLDDVPQLAG